MDIEESNRLQWSQAWAINYIIRDGKSYVTAGGRDPLSTGTTYDFCNFLIYDGIKVKIEDEIKANVTYELDTEHPINILNYQNLEGAWKEII